MSDECEGCCDYNEEDNRRCLLYKSLKQYKLPMRHCPCTSCLVKVMCTTTCSSFSDIFEKYGYGV